MMHVPHRHQHLSGTRSNSRHVHSIHSRAAQQQQQAFDDLPLVIAPKYVHGTNSDFTTLRQKLVDQITDGQDINLADRFVQKAVQCLSNSSQEWYNRLDISDSHVFPQLSPLSIQNNTLKESYNHVSYCEEQDKGTTHINT